MILHNQKIFIVTQWAWIDNVMNDMWLRPSPLLTGYVCKTSAHHQTGPTEGRAEPRAHLLVS